MNPLVLRFITNYSEVSVLATVSLFASSSSTWKLAESCVYCLAPCQLRRIFDKCTSHNTYCKSTSIPNNPPYGDPVIGLIGVVQPVLCCTVSLSITSLSLHALMTCFTSPALNSGCACSVRTCIGGIEPPGPRICVSRSENCTIPWFLVLVVDPSG